MNYEQFFCFLYKHASTFYYFLHFRLLFVSFLLILTSASLFYFHKASHSTISLFLAKGISETIYRTEVFVRSSKKQLYNFKLN